MLLNLEVNITAGSLTSCPGRGSCGRRRRTSSCAMSTAGGDVLSTRSTGIVLFLVVVVLLLRGDVDGATRGWRRAALLAGLGCMAATARSGCVNAC